MATLSYVAAIVAIVVAVLARRRRTIFGTSMLVLAALAVAIWDLAVPIATSDLDPTGIADTLWLPSIAIAAQAFFIISRRGVVRRWQPPVALIGVFAAYPPVLGALLWPKHEVAAFTDDRFYVVMWIVQACYCLTLIGTSVVMLGERRARRDSARRPVTVVIGTMVALVLLQTAQVPGINLVATVALVLIYRLVVHVRFNERVPAPAVSPLGALEVHAFAFDHQGLLVEATRSALRLVASATGREPRLGDTLVQALGPDVEVPEPGREGILVLGHGSHAVVAQARTAAYVPPRSDGAVGTILTLWYAEPACGAGTAARDTVTGTLTRRALDAVLEANVRWAARTGEPLTVALVDLDKLKQVNDEHGHVAGDAVLASVAERVLDVVDRLGYVGRFGGDELVVVLPGLPADLAAPLAETLVEAARHPVVLDGVRLGPSVSVGVATYEDGDVADLLGAADAAMYGVKREGGGAVGLAGRDAHDTTGA